MATYRDPETGVELNHIPKRRVRLDEDERETARKLRARGYKIQDIAAMLGTNQGRVHDALGLTGKRGNQQDSFL